MPEQSSVTGPSPPALLDEDEPSPYEVVGGGSGSPYVVVCDHAGRRIPRALGALGLPERELPRHIAWDIGAGDLARHLARALDGWLILQTYSRLVIDCNRPLTSPESIVERSEDTVIPGNQSLGRSEAQRRVRDIFEPYHARIRTELDQRAARGAASVVIFVHSFTPIFQGIPRPWHAGVLHCDDARLALPLLARLRRDTALTIGHNQPYAADVLFDYGIVEHGQRRGLLHVEIEVRQDLLGDEEAQRAWAERLAREIVGASASLP